MKKRVVINSFVLFVAGTTSSVPSLGWWSEGVPGSTHERWDFTRGFILPSDSGYTADPDVVFNPYLNRVAAKITPIGGVWDISTLITGTYGIMVAGDSKL
jgi:hypothetical protein